MDYMPFYHFQSVSQICDIWMEWSIGLNGYLPISNLNEGWGARWWRGNHVQGTENFHHVCLVELINKLAAKPGWDVRLALRFLQEKYEGTTTPHKFCDYIQANNGTGLQAVLQASLSFST